MDKMKDLIILGTGNHDIIRLIEFVNDAKPTYNLIGFLERDESKIGQNILGYPICGNDDMLKTEFSKCGIIVNIFQTPQIHDKVCNRLKREGFTDFPNIIHPTVNMKYVNVGVGNIIYEFAHFGTGVSLGNFNLIYPYVSVGHETIIEDSNLMASKVTIGSRAKVGNCNLFSNISTLSNSRRIGDNNKLGVGSVLLSNLDCNQSVLGNPAKDSFEVLMNAFKGLKLKEIKEIFK